MAITKKKTINYNFAPKHKAYIKKCASNTFNFAEGAVRAGKTVDHIFAFAHELKVTKDKLHLATGSTGANAKLNIGDCNGFGLEYYFRGQCRWGKFKDNECLYIKGPSTHNRLRIVIFAGGGKADSYKKIRGNSYGMWIATEINLHHDNTIKEAFNRCLAADKRKIFWDLNPDNPNAFIYTEYIDNYEKKNAQGTLLGGYNYEHFTIDDNINITEQRKNEIKSQYDKDSIWYIRDILGKRCIAEGLIYRTFADDISANDGKRFYISHEELKAMRFQEINIAVDFGGSGSGHAFSASGITNGYRQLVSLCTERWKEGKEDKSDKATQYAINIDPDKLGKLFVDFVKRVQNTYGYLGHIEYAYMDSAEQTLIRGLRSSLEKAGLGSITVRNARKNIINDRIKCLQLLMAQGRYKITHDCQSLVSALNTAIYNPKNLTEDERLDDGSSDIDSLDSNEYSWEKDMRNLIDAN